MRNTLYNVRCVSQLFEILILKQTFVDLMSLSNEETSQITAYVINSLVLPACADENMNIIITSQHPPLRWRYNESMKMIIDLVSLTYLVVRIITYWCG